MARWDKSLQAKFEVKAAADNGPVEVNICGYIGDDYFDDSAMGETKFLNALKGYDTTRALVLHVNSPGGSVKDGLGIYNAIKRWKGPTEARITGFACSIASVFPLAADKVVSPKSSNWMIHDPLCMTAGNAEDHKKSIAMLESCAASMVAAYVEATGKSAEDIRAAMKAETWFTGEEAVSWGLADETNDEPTASAIGNDILNFRNVPDGIKAMLAPKAGVQQNNTPPMQNTNTATAAPDDTLPTGKQNIVTPAAPVALPDKTAELEARLKASEDRAEAERVRRIDGELAGIVAERPWIDSNEWRPLVIANESVLAKLRAMPVMAAGVEPIRSTGIIAGDIKLIDDYAKLAPSAAMEQRDPRARQQPLRISADAARKRIEFRRVHGAALEDGIYRRHSKVMAANTVSSTLKPDVLSDALVTVMTARLAPWNVFTRFMSTDPIRPEATIQIKKATAGSTVQTNPSSWESGDSTLAPISVNPDLITSSFQMSQYDRNYGFDLEDIAQVNAEAYANSLSDVVTAVMTTANFGAATAIGSATTFDTDGLKPILALAKNYRRKILLLDGGHWAYLMPSNRESFNFAEQGNGSFGFDRVVMQNRWTGATTNAAGFVCGPDALAIASGPPLNPRSSSFDMVGSVTIEGLGVTVLYTSWFNTATRIQWASYELVVGCGAGDTTQAEVLITA